MGFLSTPLERRTLACWLGPHFLEVNGERTWEEVPPRDPPSGGVVEGRLYFSLVTWPAALSLNAGNGPSTGWAGWGVGRCPLGEGRENPFDFPLFPPVNKPLLPPARAGGRAMRRWSWRPQARLNRPNHLPRFPPEWGSRGRNILPPWCSFPYFSRKWAPPGRAKFPHPFQRLQ